MLKIKDDVDLDIFIKEYDFKPEYDSPFRNSGNSYKNKVFEVQAYSWDDEVHQEYNFKCGDVEISWYKYLGRDTTINDNYEEKYIIEIFNKCIESLNKENMKILKEIE